MSPHEIRAELRRRKLFSYLLATVSIVAATALYLGVNNLLDNATTNDKVKQITRRVIRVERPSPKELAERVRLGRAACLHRPRCRRALRRQEAKLRSRARRRHAPHSNPGHGAPPSAHGHGHGHGHGQHGHPGSPPPAASPAGPPPSQPGLPLPQLPVPSLPQFPPLPPIPPLP